MPARLRLTLLMAGGLCKAKHLLFFLLAVFLLSSCISIEKRKYMDGYHVEWTSKEEFVQSPQSIRKEVQRNSEPVSLTISEPSAVNDSSEKNILTDKQKEQITQIVFSNDTLKKKDKPKKKHNAPQKDDEKRDVTKDYGKNYPLAVAGLILGIIAFASLFWIFLGGLGESLIFFTITALVSSTIGLVLSCFANKQIKKHEEKYEGRLLANGGFILSMIVLTVGFIYFYFAWLQ